MKNEAEILKRKLKREIAARIEAETLLEKKAAELYELNQDLQNLNSSLEKEVENRTRTITYDYAKLKTLVNSLNGGIMLEDKNRKVALINNNFCHLFGIKNNPEELVGTDISEQVKHIKKRLLKPARFEKYINKILEWKRPVFNVKLKLKDGVTLQGDYIPIFSENEYTGHMWHYRDISKQQDFQMELINARDAEKHFLSSMSHEIRTPINSIIGMSKLLNKEKLNENQKKYLNGIIVSSQHLLRILNHILDFNKIRSGKIILEESDFDLSETINSVIDSLKYKAEEKSINFTALIDPNIKTILVADSVKLKQVLVNLAGNSLKFTESGFVKINCKLIKKNKNSQRILFEVVDSGIGIHKENLHKIFESFTQEDQTITKNYGGTGLGLTISKEIVILMGGKLKVDSVIHKGSKFHFTITLKNGEAKKLKKDEFEISTELLKGKKILVAEDYAPNRFIVQTFLKNWNATAIMVNNGKEAVDYFKNQQADLVLMDVQMPIMNGIEATSEIRKMGINIPIIGLSATVVKNIIESGFKSGMNDYISKPFEPEVLFSKILSNLGIQTKQVEMPEEVLKEEQKPETKLYTIAPLLKMVNGDKKKAAQLIQIFVENAEADKKEIENAWKTKNFNQLNLTFHKIKSAVRMLSMKDLAELLAQGEELAKKDTSNPRLEKCVTQSVKTLTVAIDQLKKDNLIQ